MEIIYTAITLFGISLILRTYLLTLVMREKETPKGASIINGLFTATGLCLLILYCADTHGGPLVSIMVFSIAALGGLVLLYRDLTGRKIPKWLGLMQEMVAVGG